MCPVARGAVEVKLSGYIQLAQAEEVSSAKVFALF